MGTKIKYGRYMSTYGFVQENGLEKVADIVLGKDWEAEDDVTQIQMICDYIKPDKYVVTHISGLKYEEDIEVRAMDDFTSSSVYEWMNLFVDFVQEYDRNIYNSACEYADKMQEQWK